MPDRLRLGRHESAISWCRAPAHARRTNAYQYMERWWPRVQGAATSLNHLKLSGVRRAVLLLCGRNAMCWMTARGYSLTAFRRLFRARPSVPCSPFAVAESSGLRLWTSRALLGLGVGACGSCGAPGSAPRQPTAQCLLSRSTKPIPGSRSAGTRPGGRVTVSATLNVPKTTSQNGDVNP